MAAVLHPGMGTLVIVALGWVAAACVAIAAIVSGHDPIAAAAIAAVTILGAIRHAAPATRLLVAGAAAVGTAAIGVTVAATSAVPAVIGAAAAIAFAAIVQQYATLVCEHLAPRTSVFARPTLGIAAGLGLAAFLALGRPPLPLVAVACWCVVECSWLAVVRGLALAQHDRSRARPPVLPPLAGRARWRRLGEGIATSRDTAFWGLVVARPLARGLLWLVAEQRWITPNRVTVASIAVCAGAAIAIVEGEATVAIVLIAIRSVLDSVDGQLARYRACGTLLGSYVDKVSDLYCWGALFAALGIHAFAAGGSPALLLLPLIAAIVNALFGMALWLARALVPGEPLTPPPARIGLAAWAGSLWRIVLFEEPDFYLWIALAVATARFDIFVPLIAGAYVARALVLLVVRAGVARAVGKESPA